MMAKTTAKTSAWKPHYAWIVLGVTFATLLVAGATRATPGVLSVPLEQHFGWSRATISLAVSLNLVLFGLMGPFSAALVEYLGARRTMIGAILLVATGVALTALMQSAWQLILLWGLVVGAGTGMMALALGATVVNRWFTARRGLAMGILTASNATGQLIFLPLLAALVEAHGWRVVTLVVAAFGLAMIPVIAIFMRNHPFDVGANRYGEPGRAAAPVPVTQNPAMMALRTLVSAGRSLDFWLLFFSFYVCGLSIFAVFYGLDWVATVPPTVRLTADVFGREKSGLVFGWIFTAHQLGAATAAYGAGAIRTDLGNYILAVMISGAFCLLAAVMVLGIGRKPLQPVTAAAE